MSLSLGISKSMLQRVEKNPLPPAIVLGANVTGLTIARSVASLGADVIAVDSGRRRFTGFSGAFELLTRPEFRQPAIIDFLLELSSGLPRRPVLLVAMDRHVELIAEHAEAVRGAFDIAFPEPATVELLLNKQRFAALAVAEGWPVPRTIIVSSMKDLKEGAGGLVFPVILKPSVKTAAFAYQSPAKAFRCETLAELEDRYRMMEPWEPNAVVQEWIPGGDDNVYFSFHYHDRAMNELCSFEGQKIRQWRPECGSTSAAVPVANPRVGDLSRRILQSTGCIGFGSVEYKRDPRTDLLYVTEPTVGRCNLQVGLAIANGTDIVARAYSYLAGREYVAPEYRGPPRTWVLLGNDLKAARHYIARGQLTWWQWLKTLRGPLEFPVWRWSDPAMAWRSFADLVRGALRRTSSLWRRKVAGAPGPDNGDLQH